MKYFMVCINPECDQPLHPVSGEGVFVAANMGLPVIASITGDEPPVEAAITAIEAFLESNPEDKMKDMAYEKLKAIQNENSTEDADTEASIGDLGVSTVNGTVSPAYGDDDYYRSAEYKAHRARMEALEVERVNAEILNQKAQTKLIEAKVRLTEAEAESIEQKFRPSHRKSSQPN